MSKFIFKNKATLLAIVGSIGVIVTAVSAVKATPKAIDILGRAEYENKEKLSKKEIVAKTVPVYIPTILIGTATIACIIGADILSKNQQKCIASAYILAENAYKDYKNKVRELYGEETHQRILEEIAVAKDVNITASTFIECANLEFKDSNEEERLFYDFYSSRYFKSTISKVLQAEYHLNRNFILGGRINVNQFYEFLGLDELMCGDEIGWDIGSGLSWIDFNHKLSTLDDGMECYIIDMVFEPSYSEYE